MFWSAKIIRCGKCKRLFSNMAPSCPECHARAPRGWVSAVVPAVCVVLAIILLAWTLYMLANRPQDW